MTPKAREEQAKALYDSLECDNNHNERDMARIASALKAAERGVWEEAAKGIEDGVDVQYECGPDNWKTFKSSDVKRMAAWCRAQAARGEVGDE